MAAVLTAGGLLAVQLTTAQQPPRDPGPDPFLGLNDDAKKQAMQRASAAEDTRQAAFVKSFASGNRDARSLRREKINVFNAMEASTLVEAAALSPVIVRARVVRTDFNFSTLVGGAHVTAKVLETLKGSTGDEVRIQQMGGPMLVGADEILAEAEMDPIMLPGDEVLLFLVADDALKSTGELRVLSGPGQYRLVGGLVQATGVNPFASEVVGLTASAFAERIRSHVK